ncbi:MAG: sugar phosphate isomerase/epimerase family protein [Phycisphaerae bacterium]|nr:sugar phosphate isomerase/epimerase family protein [Phycisphaerae bacterium]HPP21951.1 sugar phosphate isomerase/epimerase family protein [Phycisphaerae bacterium]
MALPGPGVVLDSFGQPAKEALQAAARLAFREVELPAVEGDVDPANLSRTGRRHLLHYVSGLGLQLSALGGDLGGARFADSASLEWRLEKTRQIIELAAELKVPVVTTHLGRVDQQAVERGHVAEVVRELADMADRTGTFVAIETGGADPAVLGNLLKQVGAPVLGAAYDPAGLLIEGFEPMAGMEPLADRILNARIRDAVAGTGSRPGRETPVGQGQIDFAEYLAMLDQAGYCGTAFIRRTDAERPLDEVAEAKRRIERLIRR